MVCAFTVALCAVAGAYADPLNDGSITLTFFNCTGPDGTPSTFQATKMLNGGSGFHLVDGTGIFRRTSVFDPVLGAGANYGLQNNDGPLVTCNVVSVQSGDTLIVSGFFAPVGENAGV